MKAKKILMIAACFMALLTSCGTKDDLEPDLTPTPSGAAADNGQLTPSDTSATPSPDGSQLLSMDAATKIACEDAGVSTDGLNSLHARLQEGDAGKEYAVTFATTEKSYQYYIAATDGMILEKIVDTINQGSDTQLSSSSETLPDAAATTVPDLVTPSEPSATPEDLPTPQPTSAPKATVTPAAASTPKPTPAPTSTPKPTQVAPDGSGKLMQDEAVEIARKDAGVSKNDLRNLKVELDYEDGVQVYEIEFDAGDWEYDYEVAVLDGKILKRESEPLDSILSSAQAGTVQNGTTASPTLAPKPTQAAPVETGIITQDEALEIAKVDAGISGEEIFDLEVKLDYDDGIQQYEIEFCHGNYTYEYDICALDGRIFKRECEDCDDHWHSSSHHNHHR